MRGGLGEDAPEPSRRGGRPGETAVGHPFGMGGALKVMETRRAQEVRQGDATRCDFIFAALVRASKWGGDESGVYMFVRGGCLVSLVGLESKLSRP